MSRTGRKRRRLNTLGKVTLTSVVLIIIVFILFSWDMVTYSKVELEKVHQIRASAIKDKVLPSKDTPIQDEIIKGQPEQPSVKTEIDDHSDEISDSINHQEDNSEQKDKNKAELETDKVVYLTFDDGPHPTASIEILQLLDKYDAKATYFMLEPHMKQNPDIVKGLSEKGHALGVHGVTHAISKVYKSPENFINEMNQAIHFIKEHTDIHTHLVRAPYGSKPHMTPPFIEASNKNELILWDWNVDSKDWQLTKGGFVNHTIQQINHLDGREPLVVLMHEKPTTATHLEELLQFFQNEGYDMKAIDESTIPVQF